MIFNNYNCRQINVKSKSTCLAIYFAISINICIGICTDFYRKAEKYKTRTDAFLSSRYFFWFEMVVWHSLSSLLMWQNMKWVTGLKYFLKFPLGGIVPQGGIFSPLIYTSDIPA